jgi:glycosyltransferase involved in cell wall biosynthesis
MKVIHNGYDMNKYYYDESKKKQLRRELNIPEKSLVIGSIARYNEYKDHETFINAAVRLLEKNNLIHFVLLGRGVTIENTALLHLVQKSKKQNHFHFLGEKNNINDYYSLFDVFCLHSISEGFPNVLAEAMASKLTCVSTDVGDARLLIRNDKFLIPPNSPFDLSNKLNQICNMTVQERKEIGENNYKIISLQYNSEILLKSYFDLYKK